MITPLRLLVTGADGQVGRELVRCANPSGHTLFALSKSALSITQPVAIARTLENLQPHLVINAAAYTAVDRAESEPEQAFAVNRDGAGHLALACQQRRIPLLHLSTDYLFSGDERQPYREDAPVAPLNIYGQSKWEGEQAIRQSLDQHIIVRTSWLFGFYGHNFVKTMLRLGQKRGELSIINDQLGSPTGAADLANALMTIANRWAEQGTLPWGTFHYAGGPSVTWYDFARRIFALHGEPQPRLIPIPTTDYPLPARRPPYSVLNTQKIAAQLGLPQPSWERALQILLAELKKSSLESLEPKPRDMDGNGMTAAQKAN